ncbi:MAG TPA: HEAT repeat domain-containing protein [Thermoanaerobaculia bacterium]|nr:HEAT repeat domain-containing protein [Thermoanaerobaculia bacterium]
MNHETLIARALEDRLAGRAEAPEVARHLAECAACRHEMGSLQAVWEQLARLGEEPPAAAMRAGIDSLIAEAAQATVTTEGGVADGRRRRGWRRGGPSPWAVASTLAALLAGVLVGVGVDRRAGAGEELRQLRRQLHDLEEVMVLTLLQQPSASARLKGAALGGSLDDPDRSVVAALVEAARHDPNPNVRLAAVEALEPVLAGAPRSRAALLAALSEEESPLVQIALIDVLLASDGAEARRAALQLLREGEVDDAVRDHLRQRLGRSV